jgi:hypothetical protein
VQSLLDRGLLPGWTILLELPDAIHLDGAEVFWIAEMRRRGCPLTNLTDGAGGLRGYKRVNSPEARAKMSATRKGVPLTPKQKSGIRAALGRPEVRAKLSASHLGQVISLETRAKISAGLKGRKKTPEHIANAAAARWRSR